MKMPFVMTAVAMTAAIAMAQDTTNVAKAVEPAETPIDTVKVTESVAAQSVADTTMTTDSVVAEPSVDTAKVVEPVVEQVATDTTKVAEQIADTTKVAEPAAEPEAAQPVPAVQNNPSVFIPDAEPPVLLQPGTRLAGQTHGFLRVGNSPYLVEEDIFVDPHAVLIIEPGVIVMFKPGTSLNVQGQLVVAGTRNDNVIFKSAATVPMNGDWDGIFISGDVKSEIRFATISGAKNGLVVENSRLNLQSSIIEKTSHRGLFARNAKVSITDSYFFDNEGAATHFANHSISEIQRTKFINNKVAFLNSELAQTDVTSSTMEDNNIAVVDKGNSYLTFRDTKVSHNNIGAISNEVLEKSVLASVSDNTKDFEANVGAVVAVLSADPEIPGIQSRKINTKENIKDLMVARQEEESAADAGAKSWSVIGNVMLGGNYHYVQTRKNHSKTPDVVGEDTIFYKKHYKNTFQVPGFGAEASIYLLMTSPEGRSFEFSTDLTADSWNHFAPNPMTLTYRDDKNQVILGDNQKIGGDIYMSSMPVFGIDYTMSLFRNNADQPMFQLNAFGGENRKPYLIGNRHPYLYNDYIEDGETQAQRMVYGASLKWAPLRRFDATFGAIYANDEIEDPLFRDGSKQSSLTSEPIQKSFTMFADGNWLFYPGDIELKGMVAVGRADTTMVQQERAINKVFAEEGISVSNYAKLRQLMEHPSRTATLSSTDLQEIFGENSSLNPSEMRTLLKDMIARAKDAQKDSENDVDDSRVAGLNWGSQNFAIGATLNWKIYKTHISGHIKYVGEDFYSAGSPDQLSDTREFGGELEQTITNFWTLNFGYNLNVENAANGSKTNLFGLGEGTRWGFFQDASDKWLDEHELDNDRAKYIQNFSLDNNFKIGKSVDLKVGYNLEYRTQNRPTQLHGSYLVEDRIYQDRWFKPRKGKPTATLNNDGEEYEVDAERWAYYTSTYTEEYLASGLDEQSLKHAWTLEASLKAYNSVFKVGAHWTLRSDISEFKKDSLASKFHLADTTWAKLGYYYGGSDYFNQAYPISVTTQLNTLQNHFAVTPRFKSYTRDNMSEAEITIEDEFEVSFINRFLILGANAQFRYLTTSWEDGNNDEEETEMDVTGDLNLRVNHTKRFYSEWYTGAGLYYRPDNRSSEYKDFFGGVRLNYVF